jgi:TRAP-type mannitol/chloroaromatic compound transport system permease small subunit
MLDLVSLAIFAFFIALVAWYAWGVVWQSFQSNSHSLSEIEAPLVIPQGLWFAGLVFFVMVAVLLLVRAIAALLRGDLPALFALIGSKSAVDEAQEEVLNVEHAFQQEKKE